MNHELFKIAVEGLHSAFWTRPLVQKSPDGKFAFKCVTLDGWCIEYLATNRFDYKDIQHSVIAYPCDADGVIIGPGTVTDIIGADPGVETELWEELDELAKMTFTEWMYYALRRHSFFTKKV